MKIKKGIFPFGDMVNEAVHERLMNFVREFLCVGGMPGVISTSTHVLISLFFLPWENINQRVLVRALGIE